MPEQKPTLSKFSWDLPHLTLYHGEEVSDKLNQQYLSQLIFLQFCINGIAPHPDCRLLVTRSQIWGSLEYI